MSAFQNALNRRAELKQIITDAEVEISRIDVFLDVYKLYADESDLDAHQQAPTLPATATVSEAPASENGTGPARVRRRADAAPLIRRLILSSGAPMQRGPLLNALALSGTPIGGNDPSNNLGTMMWRLKEQFVNLEGHGYWPADVYYEPAGYFPAEGRPIESDELNPQPQERTESGTQLDDVVG